MDKKLTREQADRLADELLASQPCFRATPLARAVPAVLRILAAGPRKHERGPSPFASPASPAWGVVHPDNEP